MAGNRHGAMKTAARKAGVSTADYARRILQGDKWCGRCRSWKQRSDFGSDVTRADGKDAACATCRETPGRAGPSRRERRDMAANGLGWCALCRGWSADVTFGKCRAHRNEAERKRFATDAAYRYGRRNRVLLRRRGVEAVPPEGFEHFEESYGNRCVYCLEPADTVDHLEPVSRGGRTTLGNVVPACRRCNSRKKDMDLEDWLDRLQAEGPLPDILIDALALKETALFG